MCSGIYRAIIGMWFVGAECKKIFDYGCSSNQVSVQRDYLFLRAVP
jgi:hypothetical protein